MTTAHPPRANNALPDDVRTPPAQTRAAIDRLMGQMREANERLIVGAVQAQTRSDSADVAAAQARADLDELMTQLRTANEHLATMAEDASAREERYRRLSGRLLTLQDEERRRLAVQLHDSTGQSLAALMMNLDIVGTAGKDLDARSQLALAESRALADQSAQEVRTLAYLLHPPLLDEMGLVSAVRWYAEGYTKRSGIQVIAELADVGRLPASIETALFRVVQESLTNVHRHASTSTASIHLAMASGVVSLEIHDEGRRRRGRAARQPEALHPEAMGVGVQGMQERIHQLGGTFDIAFTSTGTTVRVTVPLQADVP